MSDRELIDRAVAARAAAYSPYSRLTVGAALRAADGRVFSGCNVENASYGLTICAERAAVFAAVAAGAREIVEVAIASDAGMSPCGACRQVLAEFGAAMAVSIVDGSGEAVSRTTLDHLLPAPPHVPFADPASSTDSPTD